MTCSPMNLRRRASASNFSIGKPTKHRLASELKLSVCKRSLSASEFACWNRFSTWCEGESVRKLPAKPATVAAYVLAMAGMGVPYEQIVSVVKAADVAHQFHGLSSPLHTQIVRAALDTIVKAEPPRSWSKDEKAEWALLPPSIREIVARRESERDISIRRKQNAIAEERKRLSRRIGVAAELEKQLNEKELRNEH
jgi:hypothetical protein